jgi:heterodisulfide reductase subunit A-like polyferredoxin
MRSSSHQYDWVNFIKTLKKEKNLDLSLNLDGVKFQNNKLIQGSVAVIGAGIAGIQTALDLTE